MLPSHVEIPPGALSPCDDDEIRYRKVAVVSGSPHDAAHGKRGDPALIREGVACGKFHDCGNTMHEASATQHVRAFDQSFSTLPSK